MTEILEMLKYAPPLGKVMVVVGGLIAIAIPVLIIGNAIANLIDARNRSQRDGTSFGDEIARQNREQMDKPWRQGGV